MKEYCLLIDESGVFEKENAFVGGILTETPLKILLNGLRETIKNYQNQYGDDLGINDIHISAVLYPESFDRLEEKREKYLDIPKSERQRFVKVLEKFVKENACFFIKSINKQHSFYEEKPQTKYGACLGALFQKVMFELKEEEAIIKFCIAWRNSEKCLPPNRKPREYHNKIYDYFESLANSNRGISLKRIHRDNGGFLSMGNRGGFEKLESFSEEYLEGKDIKLLCDIADVACSIMKKPDASIKIYKTQPNNLNFSSYQDYDSLFVDNLIKKDELFIAYNSADESEKKKEILEHLQKVVNPKQKERQVFLFINLIYKLIDERTVHNSVEKEQLEELMKGIIPDTEFLSEEVKTEALNILLLYNNHKGGIGLQEKIIYRLKESLEKQPLLSFLERQAKKLEFQNRAYNNEFNNYDFLGITSFEKEVRKYEEYLEKERVKKDYLLTKMLGTVGQAYAFLGADWVSEAEKFFRKALQFHPTEIQDCRTKHYLLTLYWYYNQKDKAFEFFKKFYGFDFNFSVQVFFKLLEKHLAKDKAFAVLLFLRLLNFIPIKNEDLQKLINEVEILNFSTEHPKPLINKWLGVHLLKTNNAEAKNYFEQSYKNSDDFTLQTIAIPTRMLEIFCLKKSKKYEEAKEKQKLLLKEIKKIKEKSHFFKEYVLEKGGKEGIIKVIKSKNINVIAKWTPFAYS